MIGVEQSSENVSPSRNIDQIACAFLDHHFNTRKMLATALSVVLTKLTIRIHNTSAYRVLHPGSLRSPTTSGLLSSTRVWYLQ